MINRKFDIKLQTIDNPDGTKKLRIILESDYEENELHSYFSQFDPETEIIDPERKNSFAESILKFLTKNSK